jgi:hypothetical protein
MQSAAEACRPQGGKLVSRCREKPNHQGGVNPLWCVPELEIDYFADEIDLLMIFSGAWFYIRHNCICESCIGLTFGVMVANACELNVSTPNLAASQRHMGRFLMRAQVASQCKNCRTHVRKANQQMP